MKRLLFGLVAAALVTSSAGAQTDVSPNLSSGLGSFYTDRFEPAGFALLNAFQGRADVLQILIDASTDAANRPGGQQGTFYNTQGRKTDVNTAGSWLFQADLWVDAAWADNSNGLIRTDLWGTATDDAAFANPSAYPIVGFTNYGGDARFRGYDVNTGAWLDFGDAVMMGAWNTLGMGFDAGTNTFSYYVNGSLAGSVIGTDPSTGIANAMFQAYNFNDPLLGIAGNAPYAVHWSNTPATEVPEPGVLALLLAAIAMTVLLRRGRTLSV